MKDNATNGHNPNPAHRCLFCNAELGDRKRGTLYCSEAHKKRYMRLDDVSKLYPKLIAPGLREVRCNVHGEVTTESWLPSLQVWHGSGCKQCARLVAIRPLVEERLRGRRLELHERVDQEMTRRSADLQKMVDVALEGQRAEIFKDMTKVLRGSIAGDLEAEMDREITAELLQQAEVTA